MLPVQMRPLGTGEELAERQESRVLTRASRQAVGGRVVGLWTGFREDALERLRVMEEMIRTQTAMTSAALDRTNLVIARAVEDLEGIPTSESEVTRTE